MLKILRNKKGFTLLELLIVIAIIGALIALALPRYENVVNKAKTRADLANTRMINASMEIYLVRSGTYPTGAPGTAPLTPNVNTYLYTNPRYFDSPPKDPYTGLTGAAAYPIEGVSGNQVHRTPVHSVSTPGHTGWDESD